MADPILQWSITLSRALGSLGEEIAIQIGAELGFRIVRKELINMAARMAGHPEVALAAIDDLGLLNINPTLRASQEYQDALAHLMRAEAERGACIIIGRAGQVILGGYPYTFHVRVTAPLELRVERIAHRLGISQEAALEQVKTTDHTRSFYVRRYYRSRWDDANQYDLVINTARMDSRQASSILCAALRARVQSA